MLQINSNNVVAAVVEALMFDRLETAVNELSVTDSNQSAICYRL